MRHECDVYGAEAKENLCERFSGVQGATLPPTQGVSVLSQQIMGRVPPNKNST